VRRRRRSIDIRTDGHDKVMLSESADELRRPCATFPMADTKCHVQERPKGMLEELYIHWPSNPRQSTFRRSHDVRRRDRGTFAKAGCAGEDHSGQ
jgi:hypothetical protein